MRGPEGAAELFVEQLRHALPMTLAIAEQRHGLERGALDRPRYLEATEVSGSTWGLDKLPSVSVAVLSSAQGQLVHAEPGLQVYENIYSLRVEIEVAARTAAEADLLRKRWILAVREALLADRRLRAGEVDAETGARLVPAPVEDYSPLGEVERLTVCGARSDWQLILAEDLGRDVLGTVAGAELDVRSAGWDRTSPGPTSPGPRPVPIHPALAP